MEPQPTISANGDLSAASRLGAALASAFGELDTTLTPP